MSVEQSSPRAQIRVLHFTCSHCGSMRHYRCEPMLNGAQLDRMKKDECLSCGSHGGAVSILMHNTPTPYQLEAMPLFLASTGH